MVVLYCLKCMLWHLNGFNERVWTSEFSLKLCARHNDSVLTKTEFVHHVVLKMLLTLHLSLIVPNQVHSGVSASLEHVFVELVRKLLCNYCIHFPVFQLQPVTWFICLPLENVSSHVALAAVFFCRNLFIKIICQCSGHLHQGNVRSSLWSYTLWIFCFFFV